MSSKLNPKQMRIHNRINTDLVYFGSKFLKIFNKDSVLMPFVFNQAQTFIHHKIEKRKQETGMVREISVKGRQAGATTYFSGRHFHRTIRNKGTNTFILTHLDSATDNVFRKVKTFYKYLPVELQPRLERSNKKELIFNDLDSRYAVGTAGSKDVGRSDTIQCFHGSEVAYWKNSEEIISGLGQTIPRSKGTEIVFESTANGMGNLFYNYVMNAIEDEKKGVGDFRVTFTPWYWQPEYQIPCIHLDKTDDEYELQELYGLNDYQLNWRRQKIKDFTGDLQRFKREYPCCIQEAFSVSGASLINNESIMRARQSNFKEMQEMPMIMGVDNSGEGKDNTVIVLRRGRQIIDYFKYQVIDPMELVGILINMIKVHDVEACFLDHAYGHGINSRLKELGYGQIARTVQFGSRATDEKTYSNKRAEMMFLFKEDIEGDAYSIPDEEELHADILCMPKEKTSSNGRLQLISKDIIKKDLGKSPDILDAVILTYAFPVISKLARQKSSQIIRTTQGNNKSQLSTMNRWRNKK